MKDQKPLTPAQQKLVELHLPLVRWAVTSGFGYNESIVGLELDDLLQEGALALCHAAATYHAGDAAFSTYAVKVIRNHLLSYCREISRIVAYTAALDDTEWAELSHNTPGSFEAESISRLYSSELFQRRRASYKGSVLRGLDALELKVLDGYGVTDIARLYGTKANLVGAWISKATKQMRQDLSPAELDALSKEHLEQAA